MKNHEFSLIRTFIIEILLCVVIAMDICACILIVSRDPDSYGAASITKMERLKGAPPPRLILVGGSGVAFNTNSSLIEKETGLHSVNMGLYAGFGIDFLSAQADSGTLPGDIILIVPEYDILESPPSADGFLVLEATQEEPGLLKFALGNPHSLISIVRQFPGWFSTRIMSLIGKTPLGKYFVHEDSLYHRVYRASSFNAYGDMVGHIPETYRLGSTGIASSTSLGNGAPDQDTLGSINSFITKEEKRGVTVLFSWPALPKSLYDKNKDALISEDALIEKAVGKERILGTQENFIFDDANFFDSINHLTGRGRDERTTHLVHLLTLWLMENKHKDM